MTAQQEFRFEILTPELVQKLEPWFDDPETIRYLGARDWLQQELTLMHQEFDFEFHGNTVLSRYDWVIFDTDQAIALVVVEPYRNQTASLAFVVAPEARGLGFGQRVLVSVCNEPALENIKTLFANVEPENMACCKCLTKAGFETSNVLDEDGFLEFTKSIH